MSDVERLALGTVLVSFPGSEPPGWLLREVGRGLAGVTLFAINGNVPGPEGLAALTARLREAAELPLVSLDEEGGDVTRLAHETGSPYPGNAALGAVDDQVLTRRVYRSIGEELHRAGVNLDLAPSVDVNVADGNPVIGTRAFGSEPGLVARHAAAAVAGLQEAGVAACAKHFPGHGATSRDSHLEIPLIDADLELLAERELLPFRSAILARTRAIMTGHLRVPALTGLEPATISAAAITGLLRDDLGYDGVVVSDAMDMRGVSGELGIPAASVRALRAGVDLLCLGPKEHARSLQAVVDAISAAVAAGELPLARLEQAAARVAELRSWLRSAAHASGVHQPAAAADGPELGLTGARRAVRVRGSVPPLDRPVIAELRGTENIAVGPVPWGLGPWAADSVVGINGTDLNAPGAAEPGTSEPGALEVRALEPRVERVAAALTRRAVDRSLVVVVRDAHRHPAHQALVYALLEQRPDTVLVEMGLPVWIPRCAAHIATYGATYANGRAAAETLGLV